MGKKKSPKMAPLPNMAALEEKQLATGKQNALESLTANRANQVNQFGQVSWDRDPTSGAWTQTESYNPEQQALLDQQTQNQMALGKQAGGMIGGMDMSFGGAPKMPGTADYSSLGAAPGAVDYAKELGAMPEVGGYNQQVIDTMNQLQQPGLDRARASKEAQMAAMGLNLGSGRAWNTEQGNIGDTENRSRLNSTLAGIQQGNTEYNQALAGRGMRAGELGNQWQQGMAGRQQGVSELDTQFGQGMQARQQGVGEELNRYNAMMGMLGGAGPEDLNFGSYAQQGTVGTPDYTGNAMGLHQLQQAQNNAKAASKSGGGLGGMLGGIAGTALGGMAGPLGASAGSALGKSMFGG